MHDEFFTRPILNSPYAYPARHWELDATGQPTQRIIDTRRRAEFITPIPKPRKRKKSSPQPDVAQQEMVFDEGRGLSTKTQQYDATSITNEIRQHVDQWRAWPYWVPGVNNLTYGRWDFAEFTEVYEIETDFAAKVETKFNQMIENAIEPVVVAGNSK